jgi:hypothetical protein
MSPPDEMRPEQNTPSPRRVPRAAGTVAVVAILAAIVIGSSAGGRFMSSLRIAKAAAAKPNALPSFSGPNPNRQLLEAISGMIATKASSTNDEPDQTAGTADSAGKLAGFAAQLPRARTDHATLIVLGAHTTQLAVDRANLQTILAEAGRPKVSLAGSLDGAVVAVKTPRAIRAQYGNCPAPVANTLQGQLQDPPPANTDNASCVVLTESPAAMAEIPNGLDVAQLVEIALELAGMSPNQAQAFQSTLDWKSALVLSLPRGMRSHEAVTVNGAHGMLVTTAARRGPSYALIWTRDGMVFTLAGYGNPGDAVALASSVN